MELSWCSICSKQTHDEKVLYCSMECRNKELNPKQGLSSPPPSPPSDCRFSVAIATNMLFPNDLTSVINDGFLSPQTSAASSYTESVTTTADKYLSNDLYDDDGCYYSTSVPINIRQPPSQSGDSESLEINKGTFGEHKLHI